MPILNPVVAFFQRNVSIKLLKKKSASIQRGLAILISYLVMVGFIIVCLRFIIPQLYDSIRELSLMIPDIYKSIMSIFEHYRENSTDMFPVGTEVGIHVDPFDIQIMNKPESEDEEAVNVEE